MYDKIIIAYDWQLLLQFLIYLTTYGTLYIRGSVSTESYKLFFENLLQNHDLEMPLEQVDKCHGLMQTQHSLCKGTCSQLSPFMQVRM